MTPQRNLLLSTLAALAAAVAPGARAAEQVSPAAPVRVRAAGAGAPEGGRLVPATLAAVRRATISTRIAANVTDVHVQEGQRVARGQLLVSLSNADLRGAVVAAESGRAAAAAQERRIRALSAQRAATPAELEMAEAERAKADAAVAAARANLAYTEIRAPWDGTIQARRVDPGDLVGPGQPLVEVEGASLELQASLSEAEAHGLAVGDRIGFDAGGVRGQAEITAFAPGGDPVSHRRGLRARVLGSDRPLRSGTFARLVLPIPQEAGAAGTGGGGDARPADRGEVWVPRSALVERGDLNGVFVAANGKAELRWVALGEPVGDRIPIRAGLRHGEVVIDSPGPIRDGQAVEVVP